MKINKKDFTPARINRAITPGEGMLLEGRKVVGFEASPVLKGKVDACFFTHQNHIKHAGILTRRSQIIVLHFREAKGYTHPRVSYLLIKLWTLFI